jgi:hypothetical protein
MVKMDKILVKPKFLYWLTRGQAMAMALYPFILVRDIELSKNKLLINHERIHLRQQVETGIIIFFIWYGIEFLFRYMEHKDCMMAYRNISFEREAYTHQGNLSYLSSRKLMNFMRFL